MPEPSILNIIDTLAKVGVGAFISAFTAYLLTNKKLQHDIEKTKWSVRKDLLLEVNRYSHLYFSECSKLLAALDGVSKDIEQNGQPCGDYKYFLDSKDKLYVESISNIEACHGLLTVLSGNDSKARDKFWQYEKEVRRLRNDVFRKGKDPEIPSKYVLNEVRNTLSDLRSEFYLKLREQVSFQHA